MSSLPKTYRHVVVEKVQGPMEMKTVDLKQPGPHEVLVKVLACGVCHSDNSVQEGHFPTDFPRVLGHELVGDIVAVGSDVRRFKGGERVGGPWHGGHDGDCKQCNQGLYQMCDNADINGVSRDGGYAEYVLLRAEAVVNIPKSADPAEVAPLLCAGVTTFNSIRRMGVVHGGVVAVQGLGGLGHLAVQYANKMGYTVAAISSGAAKKEFATKLGAHHYIDTSNSDPVKELMKLGGANLIVCTAPNPKAIAPLLDGVAPLGKLLVLAPVGPVEFNTVTMVQKGASVHGWPSGQQVDCEDAIAFAETHGVKCMIEKFPFDKFQEATDQMLSGKVRFRSVLVM